MTGEDYLIGFLILGTIYLWGRVDDLRTELRALKAQP